MGQYYGKINKNIKLSDINKNVHNQMIPIKILHTEASIENHPTIIDEKSPAVLKYKTPHFRYISYILSKPECMHVIL